MFLGLFDGDDSSTRGSTGNTCPQDRQEPHICSVRSSCRTDKQDSESCRKDDRRPNMFNNDTQENQCKTITSAFEDGRSPSSVTVEMVDVREILRRGSESDNSPSRDEERCMRLPLALFFLRSWGRALERPARSGTVLDGKMSETLRAEIQRRKGRMD